MKPASTEFLDALVSGDTTTLCRLVRVTPRGRATIYYADHDKDVTYDSNVYVATKSVQLSAIENEVGGAKANFEMTAVFNSVITKADAERGIYDGAEIEVDAIFYDHVEWGVMALAIGEIAGTSVPHKNHGVFSCIGFSRASNRHLTEQYSPTCRADFCDARCGLDIDDFDENIIVDSVDGTGLVSFTASEVAAHPDGFYDLGTITWLTGNNTGASVEVKRSLATGNVSLMVRTAYAIEVGDTARIAQGCDKTLPTCIAYGNILNFRGEPYVPGSDFAVAPTKAAPPGDAGTPPTSIPPGVFPWDG